MTGVQTCALPICQVTIVGTSAIVSGNTSAGATFYCLAPASAGQFTVPSAVLLALPASSQDVPGFLYLGTQTYTPFTAPGIDFAAAVYIDSFGKTVAFQ